MQTMWALTRVNIFSDESRTYEVMALQPQPMCEIPDTSETVFVVLPDGNAITVSSSSTLSITSYQTDTEKEFSY